MKLQVTSKKNGFRRAGREWSSEPTVIDTSEKHWTKARLEQIQNEPMLVVAEVVEAQLTAAQKKEAAAKAEAESAADAETGSK